MKDRRIHRVDIVPHRQVRQRQTLVEQPLVQEPCLAVWCACPRFGDVACYLLPSQGQKGRLEDREVERLLLEREIEMAEGGIRRRSTNADDAPVAVRQDTGMTVEGDNRCREIGGASGRERGCKNE